MKASKDQMEHLRRPDSDLETLKTNSENLSREDLHTAEEDLGTGIFRIGTQKSQLSEEQSKKKNDTNEDEMISDLVRYLHKNGKERAVLTNYCQTHHYSLSYISRRFRQETGMTVLQYLQKHIIGLIINGHLPARF